MINDNDRVNKPPRAYYPEMKAACLYLPMSFLGRRLLSHDPRPGQSVFSHFVTCV